VRAPILGYQIEPRGWGAGLSRILRFTSTTRCLGRQIQRSSLRFFFFQFSFFFKKLGS
jgi:hypothetical protein